MGTAIVVVSGLSAVRLLCGRPSSSASERMVGLSGLVVAVAAIMRDLGAGGIVWSEVLAGRLVTAVASHVIYSTRSTRRRAVVTGHKAAVREPCRASTPDRTGPVRGRKGSRWVGGTAGTHAPNRGGDATWVRSGRS